MTVLMCVKH